MKRLYALAALAALAGCGADGEPVRPSMNANVGIGSHGVTGSAGLGLTAGAFSVGLGGGA
ncbi:argininosuccinate lyase [Roseovarius salis]|uniref:argininosuccinate lyase n=1 Tax=Roseovarius salis TaxID=3376063 RepID=UPI0037C9A7B4